MFLKRCWLVLLLFVVSTLLVHAEESEFGYRKNPFISFGIGACYLRTPHKIFSDKDEGSNFVLAALGSKNALLWNPAVRLGSGASERLQLYADLNGVPPRIGIGFKYFLKPYDKVQTLGNIGWGALGPVITGGIGYQWSRYSAVDLSLSYTGIGDVLTVSVMLHGILW